VFAGGQCEVQLVESGGYLVKFRGFLKLSCAASGLTICDYGTHLFYQSPGKGLGWVSCIKNKADSYTTDYSVSIKGRFTISRDDSKSIVYLQMNSLTEKDTAMYFCLRNKVRRFHCEPRHKPPCSVCSRLSWTTQHTQHRICLRGRYRGMKQ
jgi:immunoglobulin heavy chain